MNGKLYVVPTPVGNLEDMTYRAVRVLQEVDVVLAEDTRTSAKLMSHFDITTPMRSHHQHNEHKATAKEVELILSGSNIALISDAGTPGISDPGFLLVRACVEQGIEVECLPGATAIIPALVVSGLPCDKFYFEGFLPHKKGKQTRINYLKELPCTFAFYESPHRVLKTLKMMGELLEDDRKGAVIRELSKKFEEIRRGTISELISSFEEKPPKGEFVLVFEGKVNGVRS